MNEMAYELKTSITCINHKLHPHWKSVLPPLIANQAYTEDATHFTVQPSLLLFLHNSNLVSTPKTEPLIRDKKKHYKL